MYVCMYVCIYDDVPITSFAQAVFLWTCIVSHLCMHIRNMYACMHVCFTIHVCMGGVTIGICI
jgi:hypothetical protein